MTSQSGLVAALLKVLLPVFGAVITQSGTIRSRAFHFVSQLGIHYEQGQFVKDGSTASAAAAWRRGPRPVAVRPTH